MARSAVSDEEIQLRKRARRRLVGAIALAVLVVAAVPMILDGEPPQPPAQHIDVQVAPPRKPPPDERIPIPAPASQANLAEPPNASSGKAEASSDKAAASSDLAATPGSPAEPAPSKVQEPDAARPGSETYAVALIATASPAKAARMKRTLQRQKFPVYTQKTPDGDKTRVRVGPFASREAAEQARRQLMRQGYDPGKVVRAGE
ncbi:MAG TPA: SPOR domain-containing protein [Burkholderiales bacterium]